jgi:Mg2+/Co2+ transporter CorB
MGATLPLLVAHTTRLSGNVGRSVGTLYFINTLGSALAAGLAVILFLRVLGQTGSVVLAAVMNVTVGIAVLVVHRRIRIQS